MGYYSKIRVATTAEGYKAITGLGDVIESKSFKFIGGDAAPEIVELHGGDVVFGWDSLKWYEEYPEVAHFWETMRAADAEGVPWEFMRVGEYADDVEFRESDSSGDWMFGAAHAHLGIETKITVDIY